MARVGGTWSLAALGCAVALVGMTACGGGSAGRETPTAAVREQKPLPEEPRIERTASIGTYGGRFILGETTGPKTFNAMMANETSSTDITATLFVASRRLRQRDAAGRPGAGQELGGRRPTASPGHFTCARARPSRTDIRSPPRTCSSASSSPTTTTLHPSVQDLLISNGKKWEVTASRRLHRRDQAAGAERDGALDARRLCADHAEARARADLQGGKLRVRLQRQHAARADWSRAARGG